MIHRIYVLVLIIVGLGWLPGGAQVGAAWSQGRLVEGRTPFRSGQVLVEDVRAESAVSQLTVRTVGLTRATVNLHQIAEDSQPSSPFDTLSDGVVVIPFQLSASPVRLVIEILSTTAADLDLYLARDLNGDNIPQQSELVANSASSSALEYIDRTQPAAGTYFALVHSYRGSGQPLDTLLLAIGAVPPASAGNLAVTGPLTVPAGQLFDLTLRWNVPGAQVGEQWYGAFDLGTSPSSPGDLGYFPVDLSFTEAARHYLPLVRK